MPKKPTIKFVKTSEHAKLPENLRVNAKTGDSGFDLFATENTVIPSRGSAVVPVGIKLAYITPGYWFRIEPRSGLGFKWGILPHLGVIDNQYRGDLGVKLYNFSSIDKTIFAGDACAQFVVYELIVPVVEWADDVEQTDRGEKGFGSSDDSRK